MSRIRRLDPQTVEQIRAGEVIERPGSVVKELVENAIDAGAQTIRVQIAEGGIREVTVHDDGQGMSPEDALLAVQRHATSKIRRSSDLFGLSTLGFRGEALASIAAVSRLELVSRTADALEGTRIRAAGSEPAESAPVAASQGTTVSVRHLFFNTPPRRAFLKSPVAEGNYVEEVLVGLAVSRPGLRFVFNRDRRLVFDAVAHTGPQALARRAGAVLGETWATSLMLDEAGTADGGVGLHGILGLPEHTRATRTAQYFYVNGRQVKSAPLSSALSRAYGELVADRRFPVGVLFVNVPPRELDANVHPTKREVKFQDERAVLETLIRQVRRTLDRANLFRRLELPSAATSRPESPAGAGVPTAARPLPGPDDTPPRPRSTPSAPSRPQRQAALRMVPQPRPAPRVSQPAPPPEPNVVAEPAQPSLLARRGNVSSTPHEPVDTFSLRPQDPAFRVIGQSHELFILVEVEAELWLVDQHAAHERVTYEQVLAALRDGRGESQALLLPVTFELDASARTALDELHEYLTRLGFDIRPFGGQTYQVQAAPPYFRPADTPELIAELAQARADGRSEDAVAARQEDLAARIACKVKSVKAGQTLTPESMQALLKSLLACRSPFTCPHGRPTMVRMSVRQLEGQFDRR